MTAQTETPQQAAPGPRGRRWHYVMTLQWSASAGPRTATGAGAVTITLPATRTGLFDWVLRDARERLGASDDAVVVFASIEPDDLS